MVKDKLGAAAASAPRGDPTGKYTLNRWEQTQADFAFFDLAQDKVELKSDGWRTEKIADDLNVYEWWLAPSRSVSAATGRERYDWSRATQH
jgi:hypothetical protein